LSESKKSVTEEHKGSVFSWKWRRQ